VIDSSLVAVVLEEGLEEASLDAIDSLERHAQLVCEWMRTAQDHLSLCVLSKQLFLPLEVERQ
jgi:hypothetical protein